MANKLEIEEFKKQCDERYEATMDFKWHDADRHDYAMNGEGLTPIEWFRKKYPASARQYHKTKD